ncbi:DUF4760 domain-containing protein [Sporosarcina cascadiensis]|uniref:DUF4760 domain-containing protein n=1 Tax=Sporosarcina cascadiensis TaxID=2660747 RepID=UPI00129B211B|nr:hypothetical protein [Sporosarcina cascadiensis]
MKENNKEEINLFIKDDWYVIAKDLIELSYFLAGIVMVISIGLTLMQIISAKNKMQNQENRLRKEKSLEILNAFSSKIIPNISIYESEIENEKFPEVKNLYNDLFVVDMNKVSKEHLAITLTKQKKGLVNILNELEYISLIINVDLADEEIVYEPISTVYCNFIRDEYLSLAISRTNDVPYANIVKLYTKWSNRMSINSINKTQAELEKAKQKILQNG